MARILADRIRETSTTTGTGNFTLAGAVSRFLTFAARIANGDTFPYCIEHESAAEWEVGVGTMLTSTTFSRSVVASSNSDALVNFSAGTKQVFLVAAANHSFVRIDGDEMTGPLLASAGSAGAPSLSFAADTDTGFYRAVGADNISFTIAGSNVGNITTDSLAMGSTILTGDGLVNLPGFSFVNDPDTGIYRIGANNIGFTVGNGLRFDLTTTTATFTVDQLVSKSAPIISMNNTGTNNTTLRGRRSGSTRWDLVMPDSISESGSNAGSRFRLEAYDDAGASLGNAFVITRATRSIELFGGNDTNATIHQSSTSSSTAEIPFLTMSRGVAGAVGYYFSWFMGSGGGSAERVRMSGRRGATVTGELAIHTMDAGGTLAERFVFQGAGTLLLGADPTTALQAATKQFVETQAMIRAFMRC